MAIKNTNFFAMPFSWADRRIGVQVCGIAESH